MRHLFNTYAWIGDAFSTAEIKKIIKLDHLWEAGTTRGGMARKDRDSKISWIRADEKTQWIYDRMIHLVGKLNIAHLHLDWDHWLENLQLTKYSGKGHYTWHIDIGDGASLHRKLSATVFLNNGYSGGELQLYTEAKPTTIKAEVGKMVVFPSHILHRVKPVKDGDRISLVAWGHGRRLQ